jgi:hypothetical protein
MEENSQSEQATTRSSGIRYGLILGVVSILFFLIMVAMGLDIQGPVSYFGIVLLIGAIILAHNYFKENGNGFMSYGEGIGIAFWIALVSCTISSIFRYIYMKFIDTGMIEAMKDAQIEKFQEQGMSDSQIDQAMKISSMFLNPEVMLIMGIVFGIIFTVIVGLLVTIFTQKKSPEPFV